MTVRLAHETLEKADVFLLHNIITAVYKIA